MIMENIYKIKEDLYYIGASDRKIQLFESLQKLTYGCLNITSFKQNAWSGSIC